MGGGGRAKPGVQCAHPIRTAYPRTQSGSRRKAFGTETHHRPAGRTIARRPIRKAPAITGTSVHKGVTFIEKVGKFFAGIETGSTLISPNIRRLHTHECEPVTFHASGHAQAWCNTRSTGGVKCKQFGAKSPVFIRFRNRKPPILKIPREKIRFVHACCIDSHIVYRAVAAQRSPWTYKNSGRAAHGDSSATTGLFYLTQTLCINSAEVVGPHAHFLREYDLDHAFCDRAVKKLKG